MNAVPPAGHTISCICARMHVLHINVLLLRVHAVHLSAIAAAKAAEEAVQSAQASMQSDAAGLLALSSA